MVLLRTIYYLEVFNRRGNLIWSQLNTTNTVINVQSMQFTLRPCYRIATQIINNHIVKSWRTWLFHRTAIYPVYFQPWDMFIPVNVYLINSTRGLLTLTVRTARVRLEQNCQRGPIFSPNTLPNKPKPYKSEIP